MRAAAVTVVCAVVLGACGGGGRSATSASSTTSVSAGASTSSSASTSAPTAGAATGASTTPVSAAPTHPTAHLVAVRAARQQTVDRVVFEFSERVPGYKVSYVKKPIVQTSGREVPISANFVLEVRMEQASGFNQDTGQPTYTGGTPIRPAGTRAVGEVAQVEDFEGVLTWVAGLNADGPFRVSTLSAPPRLVIDLPS